MTATAALTSASFAYPQISGDKRADLARQFRPERTVEGTFVLSTCMRLEVLVDGDLDALARALESLFDNAPDVADSLVRCDVDAAVHLFRVVAGLESPILGESEILGQFRQALHALQKRGVVDGLLARLLQAAIPAGRQARQALPASPHASLAAITAQTVGPAERVAVLGSGLISTSVVRALRALPAPPDVTIVARSPDRVSETTATVVGYERAFEILRDFPTVVSATSATSSPVSESEVSAALMDRSTPGILIDMAMPPDFQIPEGSSLEYIGLDELAHVAARRPRHDDADEQVHDAALRAYQHFSNHDHVTPLITELMAHADEAAEQAVRRLSSGLRYTEDAAVLRHVAHAVARQLVAAPVRFVKRRDATPDAVEVVGRVFGIDDDQEQSQGS